VKRGAGSRQRLAVSDREVQGGVSADVGQRAGPDGEGWRRAAPDRERAPAVNPTQEKHGYLLYDLFMQNRFCQGENYPLVN
jgi:hypothetical protein